MLMSNHFLFLTMSPSSCWNIFISFHTHQGDSFSGSSILTSLKSCHKYCSLYNVLNLVIQKKRLFTNHIFLPFQLRNRTLWISSFMCSFRMGSQLLNLGVVSVMFWVQQQTRTSIITDGCQSQYGMICLSYFLLYSLLFYCQRNCHCLRNNTFCNQYWSWHLCYYPWGRKIRH